MFNHLKVYTVHVNPSLPHPYEAAQFIKEGFNWKAFFFTGLWALYHRLWWPMLGLFAYNILVLSMYDSHTLSHTGLAIVDLGIHAIIGFEANEWLRSRLKKQAYLTADITTGDSLLRAELRFFDRYFTGQTAA
jgi:hypothetical protein